MFRISKFAMAASLILFASGSALAHPGHAIDATVMSGLLHSFSGLDHILAAAATGALAFLLGGRAIWAIPATFVALLCVGGIAGANGVEVPAVEQGIAASVLILGILIAVGARLSLWFAIPLIATFAMFHGLAHGAEGVADGFGPVLGYFAGFLLSTAVLLGAGLSGAKALSGWRYGDGFQRMAGSAVGLAGLALLAG